jgi:ketosteroid isomerase-like protein
MKYKGGAARLNPQRQFARRLVMLRWMRANSLLVIGILVCAGAIARADAAPEVTAEAQIRALLEAQTMAWNQGDVEGFMAGYWKSEETEFVGASGVTRGWQAVLDRYRERYPDRKAMGQLTFSNLEVHVVCAEAAFAIGQFQLEREKDKPAGVFTLNFRKFPEGWRIVADHTTAFPAPAGASAH